MPFGPPGGALFRRMGFVRWDKNPNVCMQCLKELRQHDVMGAEVDISFLFADVRHSSEIARRVGTMGFTHLMQRFYATASEVLFDNDAILDKFVGDEVVGFFMPFLTGPNHAAAAVRAAQDLLRATWHGPGSEPWLPLGAGSTPVPPSSAWFHGGARANSPRWAIRSMSLPTSWRRRGPVRFW